jgi:zinc/manganese transport system substrate-binding protein
MTKLVRLMAALALLVLPLAAHAVVNVFACEPEWAALATEIGGNHVSVFSATTAQQNIHKIQARPSLIARARSADLMICSGAEQEIGWLPLVIQQSGNNKILPGQPGYLEVASYVHVIEVPTVLDRSMGDVHPRGNPHVHWDPRNIQIAANEIAKRLSRIDAAGAAEYQAHLEAFSAKWREATAQWERRAAPLKGAAVIEHHKALSYLFNWLGMPVVGALEPKPGVEPTSGHLTELVDQQKVAPAKLIVRTNVNDPSAANWLSEQTKLPAVELPYSVGGTPGAKDLFSMYDDAIGRLLAASKS